MRWLGYLWTVAIILLTLMLPFQARAEVIELTLTCQYERAWDNMKDVTGAMSGSFSAIVRMQTTQNGMPLATIDATTAPCFDYAGSFTELRVDANCKRNMEGLKIDATLYIDRINGTFQHIVAIGNNSLVTYYGRCTLAKKLF